jgi:hypothetical protein
MELQYEPTFSMEVDLEDQLGFIRDLRHIGLCVLDLRPARQQFVGRHRDRPFHWEYDVVSVVRYAAT